MTNEDIMKAFKEKGIEVTIYGTPFHTVERVVIDTYEHDKQIRADVIDECIEKLYEVTPQTVDEKLDMVFVNALRELKENK